MLPPLLKDDEPGALDDHGLDLLGRAGAGLLPRQRRPLAAAGRGLRRRPPLEDHLIFTLST